MNSRSDNRFTYRSAVGLAGETASAVSSARRQTVRARCSRAASLRPAGQDEALQRLELLVEPVAVGLERLNLRLLDPQLPVALREGHREVGADVEELVLDPLERIGECPRGDREPELRVQLLDRADRRDPRVGLGHAGAVAERGLPGVAAARVDLREPNRLVSLAAAI